MGSWYINRTFFFDVHPPLGKMLIGLSGYLTGYDGKFAFDKPGDKYENTSYLGMRMFCSALGSTIVPMAFIAVDEMTDNISAALFSSLLILFDVGLITLSQYILLDPLLLCFMMGSFMGAVKVSSQKTEEFSPKWWFWLTFTGTMLACCISVKFVGLFVVLLVGLMTISDLWRILGDMGKPVSHTLKNLVARALCLILLPIILYITFFYIHLRVLNRSGNGDGFYSSAFQSQLIGNSLHNASMPHQVAYGAIITLKNHRTGGGYLHSHFHLYPEGVGARQQQITTYTHKDDNNKWIIKKFNSESADGIEIIKNGDLVRLEHIPTKRNLHSHKEQAPITKKHFQVTGYGENGTGDANDVWRITITGAKIGAEVTAVTSKLKFVHYLQSCILTTSGKQLPKWGYEQQEVTCNPNLRDQNGLWNVEENIFEKLPNVSFEVYAPRFLERFLESHAVMFQGNAGLKPKEGEITSRPWQWPINYRGQFFSGTQYRIYLLGNPVIWWGNLVFIAVFVIAFGLNAIKLERGYIKSSDDTHKKKLVACSWLFIGWMLHYIPFWAMGRVLYFHHYFPALLFSSMITGILIDYLLEEIPSYFPTSYAKIIYQILLGIILSTATYSFYLFAPLAYGMVGPSSNEPNSTMAGLRWIESWEF
uniref:Protein O-mannosyl-transferase 2 n=1 Tax=Diabrotica virgifera virgifera TaxID=50390 RepID=A0A6P7H1P1_DIAVI